MLNAVYNSVLPFVASNSPYKGRIVALVDMPNKQGQQTYDKLKKVLADRLFTLSEPSFEKCSRSHAMYESLSERLDLPRLSDNKEIRIGDTNLS